MRIFLSTFVLLIIVGTASGLSRKHHKIENNEMNKESQSVTPEAKARAWPHLTGLSYHEVEQKIKAERPDVHVVRMKQVDTES